MMNRSSLINQRKLISTVGIEHATLQIKGYLELRLCPIDQLSKLFKDNLANF